MPACPPTPPAIISRADAEVPEIAKQMHLEGTAIVKLEIDAAGRVLKSSIQKSTGNAVLDGAATKAGRDTSFKAATESCKAVSSVFLMVVDLH
ncbi:MAG TPA: energy transducer TonB [Xanthobacteraceae bacterium]